LLGSAWNGTSAKKKKEVTIPFITKRLTKISGKGKTGRRKFQGGGEAHGNCAGGKLETQQEKKDHLFMPQVVKGWNARGAKYGLWGSQLVRSQREN